VTLNIPTPQEAQHIFPHRLPAIRQQDITRYGFYPTA
jgi:hypothetical protein